MSSLTASRPRVKVSKPRQALPPATGTARVLRPFGSVNPTTAEVAVNGKPYYVQVTSRGYRLFGYDAKANAPTCYDIPSDFGGCDCPDATFRQERSAGQCKHARAVAALVAAGALPAVSGLGARHEQETPF
jgi:hypothetical protein